MTYSSGRQPLGVRDAGVEVKREGGLLGEVGVAREDPGTRLPRLDRVLVQPAPDRRRRRFSHAPLDHQAVQLNPGESGERQLVGARQLARDRLDLGDLLRGKTTRSIGPRLILKPIQPLGQKPGSSPRDTVGEPSSRVAISMSCIPSAAYRTILARCTVRGANGQRDAPPAARRRTSRPPRLHHRLTRSQPTRVPGSRPPGRSPA